MNLKKDKGAVSEILEKNGFFAKSFPVKKIDVSAITTTEISNDIASVSDNFSFDFCNSGIMFEGSVYTVKSSPVASKSETLGEIIEKERVDKNCF